MISKSRVSFTLCLHEDKFLSKETIEMKKYRQKKGGGEHQSRFYFFHNQVERRGELQVAEAARKRKVNAAEISKAAIPSQPCR